MTKRLTGAVTLGLLACTAMGMPAAADADNDHPCSSSTPTGNYIFACETGISSPIGRYISNYYVGSERGFGAVYRNSNNKLNLQVCDMYTDNFRPKLQIQTSKGSVIPYSDWNSAGCSTYRDRTFSVTRMRLLQETLSGASHHGSAWQKFGF